MPESLAKRDAGTKEEDTWLGSRDNPGGVGESSHSGATPLPSPGVSRKVAHHMQRWFNWLIVVAITAVAIGLGIFVFRYISRPAVLSIAVGPRDGEDFHLV